MPEVSISQAYAFDKYETRGIAEIDRGTYDFDSVTHDNSWSFFSDGSATIWGIDGRLTERHNDTPISAGDAAAVIAMYDPPVPGPDGVADDVGAGSCLDAYGSEGEVNGCFCDEMCVAYEDRCPDYDDVCGQTRAAARSSRFSTAAQATGGR